MTRKVTESFIQFKKRMIDPISDTFCAAKWYNATIWLGHGQSTSCHHPPGHWIDPGLLEANPSAIHNTPHKKLMRKMMQEGTRPNECEYCWKVEDIGRENVSDRVYKTEIFKDEDIVAAGTMPWDSDVTLRTLEISFDRTCNFACSYCNPAFSTTWVNDIKKFGPYRNVVSDGRGHFIDTAPWAAGFKDEEDNPYIKAFWRWWESDLQDNLEEIRITGGEPMMAPSVWKLFDWFKDNPERGAKMRFAMNSNLVPKKALMDKLIEMSHHVPHFEVYTSQESVGPHADYIRDGMKYHEWKDNLHRLITEGNLKALHIMMTINGLCLASITDFMEEMIDIKRQYGHRYPTMTLNLLRFPSFQSPAILPDNIKTMYKEKLETWLAGVIAKGEKDKEGVKLFTDMEVAHVQRLIDYLDVIKTPHRNTADQDKLYNDFKNFYLQYDVRRGKHFRATFPQEFVDFIDSIDVPVPSKEEILNQQYRDEVGSVGEMEGDPATTEGGYISDEVAHGWNTKTDELGANEQ
jgi:organic radical activating enzyme